MATASGKRIGRPPLHGKALTTEYQSWNSMMFRCYNQKCRAYKDYGGRGITVCNQWHKFENFLEDMGVSPGPEYELDRHPDNNGNYAPGNCRWATRKQQARNRRSNHIMTLNGQSACLMEWSEITGINRQTIGDRIRRGWSDEKTLTTPVRVLSKSSRVKG